MRALTDYDLLSAGLLADPYPLYRALRSAEPLHYSERLGGWCLTRYEDVRIGLASPDLSGARYAPYVKRLSQRQDADPDELALFQTLDGWFTFSDPPAHTRLRSRTVRAFSGPMKAMAVAVSELVDELLDRFEADGGGDLIAGFGRPMSICGIADLLGVPRVDAPLFTAWSDQLAELIGGALTVSDRRWHALAGVRELYAYLGALVRERREARCEDLLGRLASLSGEDALTDDEVVSVGAMMLFAGHGTTTNLIGNGMLALLRHPRQLAALRAAPERIPAAVEELLRYDSPVQVTVRIAACDGPLGLAPIRAGDRVFLFLGSANRDVPGHIEPEELDVMRENPRHLSFGQGIRFCLGAPLARIEAPIAFARLLARFGTIRLAQPEAALRWQATVGFRGLISLPIDVRDNDEP